jgi:hypothetical protein
VTAFLSRATTEWPIANAERWAQAERCSRHVLWGVGIALQPTAVFRSYTKTLNEKKEYNKQPLKKTAYYFKDKEMYKIKKSVLKILITRAYSSSGRMSNIGSNRTCHLFCFDLLVFFQTRLKGTSKLVRN